MTMKKKCTTCKLTRLKCICPNGFEVSYEKQKFYFMEVKKVVN